MSDNRRRIIRTGRHWNVPLIVALAVNFFVLWPVIVLVAWKLIGAS